MDVLKTFTDYKFSKIIDHGEYTEFCIDDNHGGKGFMHVYSIMPGVQVSIDSLDMETCFQKTEMTEGFIQINYCSDGCFEYVLDNQSTGFINKGDISLADPVSTKFVDSKLPTRHYRGLSVVIQIDEAQKSIDARLSEAKINLRELKNNLFKKYPSILIRSNVTLSHIFSEFIQSNDELKKTYFILKTLEFLCYLKTHNYETQFPFPYFTQLVVNAVKDVCSFIDENFLEDFSIDDLAEKFSVSRTSLKNCFKGIYGISLGKYLRQKRILYAATLLKNNPELSIGEISSKVGYENQSKFSAAFKLILNENPLKYRRLHEKKIQYQKINSDIGLLI